MKVLSQPSWAAWIEIISLVIALMKAALSQPSWAAWIEILKWCLLITMMTVAALLGCVD